MLKEIELRKSYRNFSDKEIVDEIIKDIIEAGRLAPSCFNKQPCHFILLKKPNNEKIFPFINKGNSWAKNAYAYVVMACDPDSACVVHGMNYFLLDCGLAVENMLLNAYYHGLIAHSIAGFDEIGVKKSLNIPENYRVPVIIVIGYPEGKEIRERERKSLREILHEGEW